MIYKLSLNACVLSTIAFVSVTQPRDHDERREKV